jgi:hypothetical protein
MVAIVVEGKRDVTFFKNYITHYLKIERSRYKITKTDGKSILLDSSCEKYRDLCEDLNTNRVKRVLFIIDSDNTVDNPDIGGYENSCDSIEKLFSELSIQNYADYFIACDPITQEGNIENLVVSTLTKKQEACIKSFLECSELENDDGKRLLGIYNYGYPEEPFDFSHQNFNELKTKLQNLFEGTE